MCRNYDKKINFMVFFDKIDSYMFNDLDQAELLELERLLLKMNKSLEKRLKDEKIV